MAAQCADPDSIVDSTAQDAFVLLLSRFGLLVGLARRERDSIECRSIPAAQKKMRRSGLLLKFRPAVAIGSTEARLSTTWASASEPHMRRITP
jgi:hypothetical protein